MNGLKMSKTPSIGLHLGHYLVKISMMKRERAISSSGIHPIGLFSKTRSSFWKANSGFNSIVLLITCGNSLYEVYVQIG